MKNFIIYIFLIGFIYCAISDNKKNYIQNFLDKNQNKKNGLFLKIQEMYTNQQKKQLNLLI